VAGRLSTRARWRGVALAVAVGAFVACARPSPQDSVPSASASAVAGERPLPERAEAVASADALALAGARAGQAEGARLTRAAATLRARLWRRERRAADGLEALELYETAARTDPEQACSARVSRALLAGDMDGDPERTYREIYAARAADPKSDCARTAGDLLDQLAAFRPLPNVLAEIDRSTRGDASPAPSASVAALATVDGAGAIVVPAIDAASAAGGARITAVERYPGDESARVVVLVTRPAQFEVGFIPAQGSVDARLFVDVKGAKYRGPLAFDSKGIVKRVRLGKRADGTRIVLDLSQPVFRKVFYLPEPFRLVIDVASTPPTQEPTPLGAGKRAVRRVVLDAGHGGHDPGATGPNGLREKDVTLDIAQRAAPLLARELGIATLMTRDTDEFVALDERTARANAFKADLFVSIHCNASLEPQARGFMTFVLDDSRDSLAAEIAALENSASAAAATELASAMRQVVDPASLSRSVHFAELLQRSAAASLGLAYSGAADRGVRRAGFYVLAGAHMPAVLFEVSFISDEAEELRLNTGDYRQKLADAIVNAVRAYRDGR
jgi:N-acetylmuramoyl-L-alanine amidase